MSNDDLQMPTGQELSSLFQEEERRDRGMFQDWTEASNSPAASKLSDALHTALGFAYFVANAQGGKLGEKRTFELVELLQKGASYGRAALLLLRSGHLSECIAIARQLAEGCNLLVLFEEYPSQLTEYVDADENGRAKEFRVGRVREKLETCGGYDLFSDVKYDVVSRRFTHFSTSSVYLNAFSPNPLREHPGFQQGVSLNLLAILSGLLGMFLRSALTLLDHSPEDPIASKVLDEIREATEGMSVFTFQTE